MKKFLLPILLLAGYIAGAQTGSYSVSRWLDPYAGIDGGTGTVITTAINGDEITATSIPIGFTFSYCGTNYTQLSVSDNGWISLTNSTATTATNWDATYMSSISGGVGLIMPFWDDLKGNSGTLAFYQTSGSAPTRVFTFQWGSESAPWQSYGGLGTATFQVKLYETSGVIEYHYGPSTYSNKTATIGIANSVTDYRTLPDELSSAPSSIFYYLIDTTPPLNTVIEWAPPCPSPPPATTGTNTVCAGSTTTLANATTGGTWYSSSVSVADVDATTGVVTGVAAGVTNITYRVSPGCFAVTAVTVDAVPDTIAGGANACEGKTKLLTDATTGGTWSSSNTAVGSISTSGTFDGITTGTTTISYTLATTCQTTLDVTVNPEPTITGSRGACLTDTTVLTSAVTGGTWSSSNTGRALVDAYGNVTGVTLGAVIITYTAPSGCIDTQAMVVQTICGDAVKDVTARANKINIFPHPTNGNFSLSLPVSGSCEMTICDVYGKTIVRESFDVVKDKQINIDKSSSLPAGNYILKMVVGEQMYVDKLSVVK